jgi:HNH endonuclease
MIWMIAITWWNDAEFEVVKQELARPTFRRRVLMRAMNRFRVRKGRAAARGIPFPSSFYEWWQDGLRIEHGDYQPELTQALVRELFEYDPETGVLTWRRRDRGQFESYHACNAYVRYEGESAGSLSDEGYLKVTIFGRHYKAHRVIFLWMTGRWPDPEVDHENHNRADNRWVNLVETTQSQNLRNQTLYKNNATGRIGVSWCEDISKFRVRIGVGDRNEHLGYYDTFEEACAAREAAERKYGYHERHGEFRD